MKRKYIFSQMIIGFLSIFLMAHAQADIPVWAFKPLTPTTITVAKNSTYVNYRVTNQSIKPHTLEMKPIAGITQVTAGKGICGNPFRLTTKGSSCILSLLVNGSQIRAPINDGPIVCQKGSELQCYRPSEKDILHISKGGSPTPPPVGNAIISASPPALNFVVGGGAFVTVSNTAPSTVSALNIQATKPVGSAIVVQNNCPPVLAVGANCTINFTSTTVEGPTTITIQGTNTNKVSTQVTVSLEPLAVISAAPPTLTLQAGGNSKCLTITNTSSTITAVNIQATLPASWTQVVQNASDCVSVGTTPTNNTCQLCFNPGDQPHTSATISIAGTNTTTTSVQMSVSGGGGGNIVPCAASTGGTLMYASVDVGSGIPWQPFDTSAPAGHLTGASSLTDGAFNTTKIVGCLTGTDCSSVNPKLNPSDYAAGVCDNYSEGGFNDWYLPARNQFLCLVNTTAGLDPAMIYWTSTEDGSAFAIASGGAGGAGPDNKIRNQTISSRCVRTP